jgi:hypothetical protein
MKHPFIIEPSSVKEQLQKNNASLATLNALKQI